MNIDYLKWHDGIGYDLEVLRKFSIDEKEKIEHVLINHGITDWRDIDALAELGSEKALAAIRSAFQSDNYEVRIRAIEHLLEKKAVSEQEIEAVLVETIPLVSLLNGQTFTLRLAEKYPTLSIKRMLLWCSLNGNDDIRVHAAALVCYLYGVATSSFDWKFRPFFLRFGDKDLSNRMLAYNELCDRIRVDPKWAIEKSD